MFSRTTASPSESGVVAFMTSTLSCDDWNSDANWSASLVASFLCGPPDQPPAPPTYLIETCACTARSRAAPLRESSARRSAGAARARAPPRCPKAECIAKLMTSDGTMENGKTFSKIVRKETVAQWKFSRHILTNLHALQSCAKRRHLLQPAAALETQRKSASVHIRCRRASRGRSKKEPCPHRRATFTHGGGAEGPRDGRPGRSSSQVGDWPWWHGLS